MKKKCLECVVLLLFIFALTHGIIQNTQPLKETKEVQTEYEEKTSQVTEKSQETEPEVQDLENQILRTASGKFFQKYPVDEAFMGWIETKYGSGVLQSLYTQLENGNQDPDLWYRFTGNSMHVLWLMYCRQQQYMSYSYEDCSGKKHPIRHASVWILSGISVWMRIGVRGRRQRITWRIIFPMK